jgi:hypothetical protein
VKIKKRFAMRDEDLREELDRWLRPVREAEPPGIALIKRRLRRRRSRNAAAGVIALGAAAGIAVTVQPLTGGPSASPRNTPVTAPSAIPATSTRPSPIQGGYQRSASYTVSSPVSTLAVSGGLGDVTVTGSQRSTVSVTETMQYSAAPPTMTRRLAAGRLTLGYTCPSESMCVASYDIRVPRGITVKANAGNGQITLSSLAGPVTATSGLGTIMATGLTSDTADFSAGNGDIDAVFTTPPAKIHATAGLGTITLHVPGTASYHVSLQTSFMGSATVAVPQSSSSPHSISATAPMGTVIIEPGR